MSVDNPMVTDECFNITRTTHKIILFSKSTRVAFRMAVSAEKDAASTSTKFTRGKSRLAVYQMVTVSRSLTTVSSTSVSFLVGCLKGLVSNIILMVASLRVISRVVHARDMVPLLI